ncbi:SH3 domain-containing protein [Streptomyces sp. NBC_01803]|uniref:SH3 domain-containing protein n=1 Tax=Streptomyces sp. NBC_01803 TaxID=2975946 RepID=UPI002DD9D034|nr:SH3 domain-containing protein [Streptomyces sp. NBC_01803]WSA44281.1 SH3 domain-containing protein [Streptomyces sp. NBC_01803]
MSLLGRLSLYAATGAVAMAVIAGPATEGGSEEGGAEGGAGEEGGAEPSDAAETPDASHPEVTAESGTDLRQAPDPGSPVLAALPRGEKLTVICAAEGAAGGTWHLVRTDHYAWAPAADIALHGAAPSRC